MKEIFAEACEVFADRRQQFLSDRCGANRQLRREVEALLQTREIARHFLADPSAAGQRAKAAVPDEAATHQPFDHVNQFKLLRLLGEGGFGAVYLAEQEHPVRRLVALKIIKLGMDTRQVIARFQAERQALAMMDHPNIARVLDAGATETGRPYFVMELVRGVPITEYCDANRLTIRQRLKLFIPVCLAVGHAHQKGVIHRDIKPSNVLVEAYDPGAPGVPKVIDFGVAKATGANLADGTVYTGLPHIIGTLEYMSPEQADLREPAVDTRSDVYSLGALLYELLTATAPFDANLLRSKGYSEAQRIIREVNPPRPSTRLLESAEPSLEVAACRGVEARRLPALLRGDLDRVVMRCLEKDRQRRYPSAVALADDVQRYLEGQPLSAGPDASTYRLRKFVLRHKAVVAGITGIVLTMLVAVAGTTTGLVRARRAERTATEQRNAARSAQQLAEQNAAAARREAQRAFTVSSFLRDVFALARPESGPGGREADIEDVLRRAATEIDRKLGERPEEELLARRMLGEACGRIFLHDAAVEQLRRAHELSLVLPGGPGSVRSLELDAEWATAMYLAGRGDEALGRARAALAECRRRWGDTRPVTWENMHSCALCASQAGAARETYELLEGLVEAARASPEGRRADRLGRYLCNWAICLRDRGEYDAASAALREAAVVIQADNFDPGARAPATVADSTFSDDGFRLLGDRSSDMISASGWIARAVIEGGDFPEALPLLQRYISEAQRSAPQGTPAIAYRIEDLAMLRLRAGDRAGAASDLARAVAMWQKLLGYDGWQPQTRWRLWVMYCDPQLCLGWRSPALRNQVWCALDDLLRDHPPFHLDSREMPLGQLRFKLLRRSNASGDQEFRVIAEGGLDQLRSIPDPPPGLYLLGLEIPRLGDEPLRKANWLLLIPWTVEFHPIVRFDSIRTEGIPRDRDRVRVISPYVYDRRKMLGLALHDGLACTTETPHRLQWFTAVAIARAEFPAGRYRFSVSSDDGHRLWVDGKCLSDDWGPQPSGTIDVEVELTGDTHDLRADLLQESGGYCLWLQVAPLTAAAKTAALKLGGGVPAADGLITICRQHLADNPHDLSLRLEYANALARAGRFREAAAQYASLIESDPTDQRHWYAQTVILAYLDNDGYQQLCRHMFGRFSTSADPAAVMRLLLVCSLRPQVPVDQGQLARLLDRALAMQVPSAQTELFELASSMASYRTGRFEPLLERLRRYLPQQPEQSIGRATTELLLAMACDHLGRHQDADVAVTHAGQFIETQGPVAGIDELNHNFENWLICQIIWREAQTLRRPPQHAPRI